MLIYSIIVLFIVGVVGLFGASRWRKVMGVVGLGGALILVFFHWFGPTGPTLAEQQETYIDFMAEIDHWATLVESTAVSYQDIDELEVSHLLTFEALARGAWNNMGNITLSGRLEEDNLDRLNAIQQDYREYALIHAETYQAIGHLLQMGQLDQIAGTAAQLDEAESYRNDAVERAEELETILQLR